LIFPNGGHVIESEPEYDNGWSVKVTPEGLINDEYHYLFYESSLPLINNSRTGWVSEARNLHSDLRELLVSYGFLGREIEDFLDFWLPVLNKAPYYAFYPQDVDELTVLDIQPAAMTLIRSYFYVKPLKYYRNLPSPCIPAIPDRTGFTVVEWGVIGAPDLLIEGR
jgi:hypothetical protein